MRRTVEEMIKLELSEDKIVMCRSMGRVFVDNLISSIPGYVFRTLNEYIKATTVARVIGAVDTRVTHVVAVPEFVSDEEKLAVLWFLFSRRKEWIIRWHEVIG